MDQEIQAAEEKLRFSLPPSYIKFLRADGLNDLRIRNRVLSPSEIVETQAKYLTQEYVPFADNGCGDLYCWPAGSQESEPPVVFADHETNKYLQDSDSFETWLAANKF